MDIVSTNFLIEQLKALKSELDTKVSQLDHLEEIAENYYDRIGGDYSDSNLSPNIDHDREIYDDMQMEIDSLLSYIELEGTLNTDIEIKNIDSKITEYLSK
jgi:hypothetical protein